MRNLANCFQKLCASTARSAFLARVAPILAEGANGLPELDPLESAMAASTLRITEVSEGGSVPFLRAENVGRKPVRSWTGRNCRREAEPDRQRQHHHPPWRGIDIPVSCMEAGRWNFNRRDFRWARRCSGPGRGRCRRRASRQAWMRKEATAATRARSGVK